MARGRITWSPHNYKHFPDRKMAWAELVAGTNEKRKLAKYAPGVAVQQLEESVVEHDIVDGVIVLKKGRAVQPWDSDLVYMVCDTTIGASLGKPTNIVLVQWDESVPGTLHGQPVTEEELRRELQQNPAEWEYYLNWQRRIRAGVV